MNTQFETWWETEGYASGLDRLLLCELAWKNGAYLALNPEPVIVDFGVVDDDDFNEPLGPACQLGDETCESCQ